MLFSALLANRKGGISNAVDRLFYQPTGQLVISIVFGIAIALMFQRACKGRRCIIIHPPPDDTEKIHHFNQQCFVFTERYVPCAKSEEAEGEGEGHL